MRRRWREIAYTDAEAGSDEYEQISRLVSYGRSCEWSSI